MLEQIEGKWISVFEQTFRLCEIQKGSVVAVISETQSRPVNIQLTMLALHQIGAQAFHIQMPTPALPHSIPLRSTGSSHAIAGIQPVINALGSADYVIDCTVEGLLHSPELPHILKGGARLFMISNEHPEVLERLAPSADIYPSVEKAKGLFRQSKRMRVESAAGTCLDIHIEDAPVRGAAGFVNASNPVAYWPGGLCLCFPKAGSTNGKVVLDAGDVNLTFKRYITQPVELIFENDHITAINGQGLDADLLRSYYSSWQDQAAYGISHVGWGLSPLARWDALTMYDKSQINGTELRAFAGNFLFSTGANEYANRFTEGHFDFPMRNCTVTLDDTVVVRDGKLTDY